MLTGCYARALYRKPFTGDDHGQWRRRGAGTRALALAAIIPDEHGVEVVGDSARERPRHICQFITKFGFTKLILYTALNERGGPASTG